MGLIGWRHDTTTEDTALLTLLLAPATAHAQVLSGINIGPPPQVRRSIVCPQPHPDNVWVDGHRYPVGHAPRRAGYWSSAPPGRVGMSLHNGRRAFRLLMAIAVA
jgi:hypothetical protein